MRLFFDSGKFNNKKNAETKFNKQYAAVGFCFLQVF